MKVSKQMGQFYVVEMDEDNRANAMPGQFIFTGNDFDDYVIGFVNKVDLEANEMEMCLMEPRVLPNNVTRILAETLTKDEVVTKLKVITDANPAAKAAWIEAVNGPTYDGVEPIH